MGGCAIILVEGANTIEATYSFKPDNFTLATGCLKVGIFHFWVLYIESHCVNILYLYFENTRSIYRKVALGFFTFFTVSSEEAYTFDSFEFTSVRLVL